jgi:hypothetical protein
MMIKVSNEFLEFNELIEVEKQIKLFEEISTTDGDFSYSFELQKTITNTRILQNPQPDNISKIVYQKIPAQLITDDGNMIHDGYMRVEGITNVYNCSFFGGNNNWFGMLSGKLTDLNWDQYDVELNEINIQAAIFNTSGVVFPTLDNGVLNTRGFALMKVEDFIAGIYVKDVFNKIFSAHGIKIQGDLLNDVNYLSAITLSNRENETGINDRSAYVFTNNAPIPNDGTFYLMQWTDDSTDPYFDGASNNFNLASDRYIADVRMVLKIEATINEVVCPYFFYMRVFLNGTPIPGVLTTADADGHLSIEHTVELIAGDYVEIHISADPAHGCPTTITDATVRFTPTFVYKFFGSTIVPDWTQGEYVSNILRIFNCISSYDVSNKTLTFDLFEKLKHKEFIDLSPYVSDVEVEYTEFISNYGKKNNFTYQELQDEDIKENFIPYGPGIVTADNDFLGDEADAVTTDFTQPISYVNPIFKASLERTNFVTLTQDTQVEITAVANSTGEARFTVSEDIFALSDLVRVTNSTDKSYNGDYMVVSFGAGWVELSGVPFNTDARADIAIMKFEYTTDDSVYLLRNVPLYTIAKFSELTQIRVENTDLSTMAYAFFNIINTGQQVSMDFVNSFSFYEFDQVSMIQQYFRLFGQVLNDPAKLIATAHLPLTVYDSLDLLNPIKILTEESQNAYYLNRIRGYKGSEYPCVLELIKI